MIWRIEKSEKIEWNGIVRIGGANGGVSYQPLLYKRTKDIKVNTYHYVVKKITNFLINRNVVCFF